MIPVTKPFLPPREEYQELLNGIWTRQWLTNMGPLASQLEMDLKDYLKVNHLLFVTNGTIALQMAIKALDLKGEIITTPFSFVATTSTIVWENCTPVFVDIDPKSLNIDATKIEAAITPNTKAILATHVYGNPCDVNAIDKIAKKQIKGKSIFEYGDISTCSLHATKLYHTTEGGLIITKDADLLKKMSSIRNFGISGFDTFSELGINGKNSEFHAAMGIVNLKYIEAIKNKRQLIASRYDKKLKGFKHFRPEWHINSENNNAYYPIVIENEELLLKCKEVLQLNEIGTRRYFYPSLAAALPYLAPIEMPITDNMSKRVLCLPMFYDLTLEEVDHICRLLLRTQNN